MFRIILSPVVANENDTQPTVSGKSITYRGITYDLSQLTAGSEVEASDPFVGKIKNVDGVVNVTLQYRYETDTSEPMQSTNWSDYTFEVESGSFKCPIKRRGDK